MPLAARTARFERPAISAREDWKEWMALRLASWIARITPTPRPTDRMLKSVRRRSPARPTPHKWRTMKWWKKLIKSFAER